MLATKVNSYFRVTNKKMHKHNNFVDALKKTFFFKKVFGSAVFEYKMELAKVESEFSFFGLICFLCWSSLYFCCVYITYIRDQSILRLLYDTKLKRYGDEYEKIAATLIVLYAMWKIHFRLNLTTKLVQMIVDIDKSIVILGVAIDHNKDAFTSLIVALSQIVAFFSRGMCIWLTIGHLNTVIPYGKIFQSMYSDMVAFMLSGIYCIYVTSLKERYTMINEVLDEIKMLKHWEYLMLARSDSIKSDNVLDQSFCKKIKMCANIHCMLYRATRITNELFGFALLVIMFFDFNIIVLYMFYFMEATASCLFHDMQRYIYFLIYVMWQAAYATGIVYINVYFSQSTVQVADHSAYIVQEIIKSDLSPSITKEALQLSIQLHHQVPTFSAYGLTLDYALLIKGALSVVTFLVMLLQFVMDA